MKIQMGIMGFGRVGRDIYRQAASDCDDMEVVAITDLANAEVLQYLVNEAVPSGGGYLLEDNWLVSDNFRTRMLQISDPHEVPWDMLRARTVVEATGRYRKAAELRQHLANGAERVVLATLPLDTVDRIVIPGINEHDASPEDRIVCAGSGTTTAFALMVRVLDEAFGVEHASMTTIHAFTSDQPAQDYAASDCRRSRSAAKNIIPNTSASPHWVGEVMPHLAGRLSGYALNVPVQKGSLVDVSCVVKRQGVTTEEILAAFEEAAAERPRLLKIAYDPIVSSDVIHETCSVTIDAHAILRAGPRIIKTLGWYDTRSHATRLLDVIRLYDGLES